MLPLSLEVYVTRTSSMRVHRKVLDPLIRVAKKPAIVMDGSQAPLAHVAHNVRRDAQAILSERVLEVFETIEELGADVRSSALGLRSTQELSEDLATMGRERGPVFLRSSAFASPHDLLEVTALTGDGGNPLFYRHKLQGTGAFSLQPLKDPFGPGKGEGGPELDLQGNIPHPVKVIELFDPFDPANPSMGHFLCHSLEGFWLVVEEGHVPVLLSHEPLYPKVGSRMAYDSHGGYAAAPVPGQTLKYLPYLRVSAEETSLRLEVPPHRPKVFVRRALVPKATLNPATFPAEPWVPFVPTYEAKLPDGRHYRAPERNRNLFRAWAEYESKDIGRPSPDGTLLRLSRRGVLRLDQAPEGIHVRMFVKGKLVASLTNVPEEDLEPDRDGVFWQYEPFSVAYDGYLYSQRGSFKGERIEASYVVEPLDIPLDLNLNPFFDQALVSRRFVITEEPLIWGTRQPSQLSQGAVRALHWHQLDENGICEASTYTDATDGWTPVGKPWADPYSHGSSSFSYGSRFPLRNPIPTTGLLLRQDSRRAREGSAVRANLATGNGLSLALLVGESVREALKARGHLVLGEFALPENLREVGDVLVTDIRGHWFRSLDSLSVRDYERAGLFEGEVEPGVFPSQEHSDAYLVRLPWWLCRDYNTETPNLRSLQEVIGLARKAIGVSSRPRIVLDGVPLLAVTSYVDANNAVVSWSPPTAPTPLQGTIRRSVDNGLTWANVSTIADVRLVTSATVPLTGGPISLIQMRVALPSLDSSKVERKVFAKVSGGSVTLTGPLSNTLSVGVSNA